MRRLWSGWLLGFLLFSAGCYSAPPSIHLRGDQMMEVDPEVQKDAKAAEKAATDGPPQVYVRIYYLAGKPGVEWFDGAGVKDLWPIGKSGEKPTFKEVFCLGFDEHAVPRGRFVEIAVPGGRPTREVKLQLADKDGKIAKVEWIGIAANFSRTTGMWKLSRSVDQLDGRNVVLVGYDVVVKERIDDGEAEKQWEMGKR